MNGRLIPALAVIAALTLAGCGGEKAPVGASPPPSPSSTPITTTAPPVVHGPAAFLTWAKTASYGEKDFASATADKMIGLGSGICGLLSTQPSFGDAVQAMMKIGGKPSVSEAEGLVREAVLDLCPQYKSLVP